MMISYFTELSIQNRTRMIVIWLGDRWLKPHELGLGARDSWTKVVSERPSF